MYLGLQLNSSSNSAEKLRSKAVSNLKPYICLGVVVHDVKRQHDFKVYEKIRQYISPGSLCVYFSLIMDQVITHSILFMPIPLFRTMQIMMKSNEKWLINWTSFTTIKTWTWTHTIFYVIIEIKQITFQNFAFNVR